MYKKYSKIGTYQLPQPRILLVLKQSNWTHKTKIFPKQKQWLLKN